MGFRPNESPRAVLACEFAVDDVGAIVTGEPRRKILGLADVKPALWILEYVNEKRHFETAMAYVM